MTAANTPPTPSSPAPYAFDVRAFRTCLGHYATGVAVVAASHGGTRCGMTINSFSALSLAPPLVMWSIRNESSARDLFLAAAHFSVNILAADQIEVSGRFAKSSGDPFDAGGWTSGANGEPMLGQVAARLLCRRYQSISAGDHTILIGEVTSFEHFDRSPLLFVQGEYRVSTPHPMGRPMAASNDTAQALGSASMMRLLYSLSERWMDEFDLDRATSNLSRSQSRTLAWLSEGPKTAEELGANIGISAALLDEDIGHLLALGYIQPAASQGYELTSRGRDMRRDLARMIEQFEQAKLAKQDPVLVAQVRQWLIQLLAT
jgi:flavin reductase (DIM6/NTAB) family NADH-FMN oxidoreductase RutF/DNA-binding HxlR family transcriptional regulator